MKRKYRIILEAEESFARAVALGVHVKRPLTTWHFVIPGMFIFDFLRRTSETRKYSELFLFPRKLALDGALRILNGEDREAIVTRAEEAVGQWLTSLKLYSEGLLRGHREQINLLIEHYSKLLQAEGTSYPALVRDVYKTRDHFEVYLQKLAIAEGEVDRAVAEIHGGTRAIWERLRAEQMQVEELRRKGIHRIF